MLVGTLWGVLVCQVFYNYKDWKCENHENKKHVHLETGHLNWPLEVQFSSVAQSCLTLCNPIDCSTPGFPVHHQHPESTQTHVHRVGDAIQPSPPLSSPFLPTFSLSQHQSFFPMSQFLTSGGQRIGVSDSVSVLPMNIQDWFPLGWTSWISLLSKGLSRVFSNTTVQKHQLLGAQLSL